MTTRVTRGFMWTLLIFLATRTPAGADGPDPTSAYSERSVQGFTVLVNRRVLEHKKDAAEALKEVNAQLGRIARAVSPKPLAKLRKVRIWLEWANHPEKLSEFHPSEQWLRENGYNPEKAGGIEVANARKFIECSRDDQPWSLMHEMAHAYQFRVLGEEHPAAQKAYKKAMDDGLYESVAHVHGGKRKAYAATNYKEYFAELTEAYFGKNDFFPFNRTDLKKYDPTGYRLMQDVWGQPSDNSAAPSRKR
jgi:hypothetical protein